MGSPPGARPAPRAVGVALVAAFLGVLVSVRVLAGDGVEQPHAVPQVPGAGPSESSTARPVVHPYPATSTRLPDDVLAGIRFVEVTRQAGLQGGGPATPEPAAADMDAGAAVTDLEGDGDLDLLLTSSGPSSGLYRNDAGEFVDITAASGIDRTARATAAAFADVDSDGDIDLFLGGPVPHFGRLLVNDGSGRFTDRSGALGSARPPGGGHPRAVRGVDFGDVDRDGDLDLLVTDWNIGSAVAVGVARGDAPDRFTGQCHYAAAVRRLHATRDLEVTGDTRLLRNEGGRLTDVTAAWGLASLGIERPFTPQLVDLDDDGWLDLAVAGDACSSRLYRNDRGRSFIDITSSAGVGTDENGMGSVVRDLDGDGRPDWLVTSISYPTEDGTCPHVSLFAGCSGNRVYLNRGRMRFQDATDELGLRHSGWGWGAVAADFGNDGRLQVAITNGRIGPASVDTENQEDVYYQAFHRDPTSFWVQGTDGRFVDAAADVGITDDAVSHALVTFDYDRDGRLDLLVANAGAAPHLYRNVSPRRHWIAVRLDDQAVPGNPYGIGAKIEVRSTAGQTTTQWLHTSGSYEAQHPAEIHVGLGDAGVSRLRVWWPGDARPQVWTNVRRDRLVTITRRP